ncbi:phosphopantetheine-binding protein [Hyphomicrobium sp. 2TAF46]|jgi:acyl carrier protein|uniref:phosphopantetheine-binding protein n=1 Tax=Hyphomicrobium sp. 2TAF46 TaxID=3233019 RepID=UPI003F9025D3
MTSQVTSLLLDTIQALLPVNAPRLDAESAHVVTLQSLNLDSLDTLKLAMDLEEALDMDIEIVNFPETLTLAELADRLSAMRERKVRRALLNAV